MANFKIEMSGVGDFKRKVLKKARLELAKKVVKTNGEELQRKMVENTKYFTGHYDSSGKFHRPTGNTKRNITGSLDAARLSYKAGPTTHYSPYVNYGTRYMTKRPFVTDAFNYQKEIFKKDFKRLTK